MTKKPKIKTETIL